MPWQEMTETAIFIIGQISYGGSFSFLFSLGLEVGVRGLREFMSTLYLLCKLNVVHDIDNPIN